MWAPHRLTWDLVSKCLSKQRKLKKGGDLFYRLTARPSVSYFHIASVTSIINQES